MGEAGYSPQTLYFLIQVTLWDSEGTWSSQIIVQLKRESKHL